MKYDYNIVAIGAGAAGLVTTYVGAAVNARVALIERHKMGGDCLNSGCVPSKALIRTAKFLNTIKRHEDLGVRHAEAEWDFAEVMERVQRVISKVEPHDSIERYTRLGVDVITGNAFIRSANEIEVDGKVITTKNIVVATGAKPRIPDVPGLDKIEVLHTDNVWELREKPQRLVILGGGPIGSELAQAFNRIGVPVTQIESKGHILNREDPDVVKFVQDRMVEEGVDLRLNTRAKQVVVRDGRRFLVVQVDGKEQEIEFDRLLCAVGRVPNTKGFGLEELGVELTESGRIKVDDYNRTSISNILACGDVSSPYQFTHMAAHGAYYCAVNALFRGIPFATFKVNHSTVPWCTYTDPELARVGLNELDAKAQGIPYEITTFDIAELDRAIAEEEDYGLVKVLTVPGKDKILGVTICGYHAGDILPEYVLAHTHGLGLGKILSTIHVYPTLGEANKYAAGTWKRAHAPQGVLHLLKRFHEWRRG